MSVQREASNLNVPGQVWIKKMQYIYIIDYYSAIKKNEVMPLAATCMDAEMIILSERSQKDECHVSLICGL